jgi:hypothetical protein
MEIDGCVLTDKAFFDHVLFSQSGSEQASSEAQKLIAHGSDSNDRRLLQFPYGLDEGIHGSRFQKHQRTLSWKHAQ